MAEEGAFSYSLGIDTLATPSLVTKRIRNHRTQQKQKRKVSHVKAIAIQKIKKYFERIAQELKVSNDPELKRWGSVLFSISSQLVFDLPEDLNVPVAVTVINGEGITVNDSTGLIPFRFHVNRNLFGTISNIENDYEQYKKLHIILTSLVIKEFAGIEYLTKHHYINKSIVLIVEWLKEVLGQYDITTTDDFWKIMNLDPNQEKYKRLKELAKFQISMLLKRETSGYEKMLDLLEHQHISPADLKTMGFPTLAEMRSKTTSHDSNSHRLWVISLIHLYAILQMEPSLVEDQYPAGLLALHFDDSNFVTFRNINGTEQMIFGERDPNTQLPPSAFLDYIVRPYYYDPKPEELEALFGVKRGYIRKRVESLPFSAGYILLNSKQPLESAL